MASVEAVPVARQRARSLPAISARHLAVVVLALAAGVANLVALTAADRTVEVLVVATDLPAGTRVGPEVFTTARLSAGSALTDRLIGPEAAAGLIGSVTVRPLTAGDPLLAGDLLGASDGGLRSMSLPVTTDVAVAGGLMVGDRVDVVGVVDGTAAWLARDLAVVAVPTSDEFGGSGYAPTLAVDADTALRLAAALEAGAVHLVRSTGAAAIPPVSGDG